VYQGARHCGAVVRASDVQITGVGSPRVDCSGTGTRHMTIEGQGVQVDGLVFLQGEGQEDGGCVLVLGKGARIQNAACDSCWSGANGGSIAASRVGGLELRNVSISRSRAGGRGGGLYLFASDAVVTGTSITGGSALEGGGGYALEARVVLRGTNVSLNVALEGVSADRAGNGGGFAVDGGEAELVVTEGSLIAQNTALWMGGGILARAGASVSLLDSAAVSGNMVAFAGGGFALSGDGTVLRASSGARLAGNLAMGYTDILTTLYNTQGFDIIGYGGAGFIGGGCTALLNGSVVFERNSANLGGGIALTSIDLLLRLQGVMQVSTGGAAVRAGRGVVFANNTGESLTRSGCGGAMHGSGVVAVELEDDVRLVDNRADRGGGAVMLEPGNVCYPIDGWNPFLLPSGSLGSLRMSGDAIIEHNAAQTGGALNVVSGTISAEGRVVLKGNEAISRDEAEIPDIGTSTTGTVLPSSSFTQGTGL
jgi:predicted outer membrane repeat protein